MDFEFKQTKWSLDDLFQSRDSKKAIDSFEELEKRTGSFEKYRSMLSEDIKQEEFLDIIRNLENINLLAYRIYGFAQLEFASDTQDQENQSFLAKVQQKLAHLENKTIFFNLWWKSLAKKEAERLLEGAGDYRYWLEEMRHFQPHTLSEPEEKIINIKNTTGVQALQNLYDSITNRYVYTIKIDEKERRLTRGELMVYARHHNQQIREDAYHELYRVYGLDAPILGQLYQTLVRDWKSEQIELRKYRSPIAARNLINDIPDEAVDILLDACQKNISIFHRYFKLKARWLGADPLRRYDIYAPVVSTEKKFDFQEAINTVLDSLDCFEPKMTELAKRVFVEKHVDSEIRKGKREGAFCLTVSPDLTPWVLLNYQGKPEDVATLAHEIGHAIHSMMAERHSLFTQQASLPLAETASTFAEMVLVDRLLEQENNPEVQKDILFRQMDDAYATIIRQAYFAIFERKAHELIASDATVDELAKAYMENLRTQFGESLTIGEEFQWEWVSIPHIYHVPFYVYAYAFGQLLVFALYQQYKEEGKSFIPSYLDILAAGGSESPEKILTKAGIEIKTKEFWQGGFDVINSLVERLEQLPINN